MFEFVEDRPGYWGPVTANNDFCEANYRWSSYIAEFWNCLSSIVICLSGFYGMYCARRYGYPNRFFWSHALYAFIGFGSAAYHGTLLREGQMLDELPMVYLAVFLYFPLFEMDSPSGKSKRPWLLPAIIVYCLVFTLVYHLFPAIFILFVLTYIGLVAFSIIYIIRLVHERGVPPIATKLAWTGCAIYVGAFLLLWLPEHFLCSRVQWFEPHAIFHVCSAIGPYLFIVCVTYETYRRQLKSKAKLAQVHYSLLFGAPFVHVDPQTETVEKRREHQ